MISKTTAQAGALALLSFGGALVVFIGAGQLDGVGWAIGAAGINAGAVFLQNIAGNANGETKGYAQGVAHTLGAATGERVGHPQASGANLGAAGGSRGAGGTASEGTARPHGGK